MKNGYPRLDVRFPQEASSLISMKECSPSRASAFNKLNVSLFLDKLQEACSRKPKFSSYHTFSIDGIVTIQKSHKILAEKKRSKSAM